MTKNYSPDQLEALAKIVETHKPATPTHNSCTSAPRVLKFASHSDVLGMIVRFKMESGAVKNLYFNSLVVSYLAAAITDIAEHASWSLGGDLLHPDAIPNGFDNPDPGAEARWEKDWDRTKVATPDATTRSHNVLSVNGEGSLDAFVMALALDNGEIISVKMSPLVAWYFSASVHEAGEKFGWWGELQSVLPGKTIN